MNEIATLEQALARIAELEGHLRERGLVEVPCRRTGVCPRCGTTNHNVVRVPLRGGEGVRSTGEGTCGVEGCSGWVRMVGEARVPR